MSQEATTPETKAPCADTMTIFLSDQAGERIQFRVRKNIKFQKVFDNYANRRGVPVSSLTFRFDGERVTAENTPKMLEMEDDDTVEVLMEQVGGLL
jgi:small ubiquitin-related modifier